MPSACSLACVPGSQGLMPNGRNSESFSRLFLLAPWTRNAATLGESFWKPTVLGASGRRCLVLPCVYQCMGGGAALCLLMHGGGCCS